uniref:Putative transmembrane protein n=1 Tax=Toxoplasma gondii TgCATBr9 TaxID=943120 RepID=A0A2T6IHQ4_TOXGO|nr:putative transmembrane protein [Toxoplasma gondii TgCATBr9]
MYTSQPESLSRGGGSAMHKEPFFCFLLVFCPSLPFPPLFSFLSAVRLSLFSSLSLFAFASFPSTFSPSSPCPLVFLENDREKRRLGGSVRLWSVRSRSPAFLFSTSSVSFPLQDYSPPPQCLR